MSRLTYSIVFTFFISIASAQSDQEMIHVTLMKYINGTSFNHPELLEEAFHKDVSFYFTKDEQMWSPTRAEYISWFPKEKAGTPTGRVGKILSVNIMNDIATAKVEEAIPADNWLYSDFFLLKKENNQWKITSKTATGNKTNITGDRILFVVSNAHNYGDTQMNTSNHFAEIVLPYDELTKAGYIVDFVSPEGGAVPLGYITTNSETIKKYLYNEDLIYQLENTAKPSDIDVSQYKAILYGGGGAAMFGVPENTAIQKLAMQIYEEQDGVVSAICHGTAGIVNLKTKDGQYLVSGKKINGFPDIFEDKSAKYYQTFPFSIEEKIKAHGGDFKYSEEGWDGFYQVDGRVITGQDPTAGRALAKAIIAALAQNN